MDIARVASYTLSRLTDVILKIGQRGNTILFELTHLFVTYRNTIAESGLQDFEPFGFGWKLCISSPGSKGKQSTCTKS
jgi:hypothetical protein